MLSWATMMITEPVTMITDYVLAVSGLVWGAILLRTPARSKARLLWGIGLITSAAAGLAGGTYHGFALYLGDFPHRALWNITVGLIGASAAFMVSAALAGPLNRREPNTKWIIGGLLVSLIGLGVQQGGISLHANFNHNDLYHCIQTAALLLFFKGAQLTD
jgi:hypothetical protein